MPSHYNIVVLISGRGSNLRSLIEKAENYKIIAVLSNRAEAPGLEFAAQKGIPTFAFPQKSFLSLKAAKSALLSKVKELNPDLVCLAGFMQIIEPEFVDAFPGRIINIHPALLPKYPGLDTHARALAGGEKEHGCSVHVVDYGVDTGAIIAQASCRVEKTDTADTLANRVLEREHALYSWVVKNIASKEISLPEQRDSKLIGYSVELKSEAAQLGYKLCLM